MTVAGERGDRVKLKEGFIYRTIAGEHVVIPTGNNIADFNGIISLNETAAFLWVKIQSPFTREDLVEALLQEYEVDRELAGKDVDEFLRTLSEHKVLLDD